MMSLILSNMMLLVEQGEWEGGERGVINEVKDQPRLINYPIAECNAYAWTSGNARKRGHTQSQHLQGATFATLTLLVKVLNEKHL